MRNMPKKELKKQTVSAQRFNEMIEYYTQELKSRISEIKKLKQENQLLTLTAIRTAAQIQEKKNQKN